MNQNQLSFDLSASKVAPPPPPTPVVLPAPTTTAEVIGRRPLKPKRKRGSPGPADVETAARDEALDVLDEKRAALIAEAKKVARQLAIQRGRVTSVEVFEKLRAYGYDEVLNSVDPRWIGCVFRSGPDSEWILTGYEATGSHKRRVSIWRLA